MVTRSLRAAELSSTIRPLDCGVHLPQSHGREYGSPRHSRFPRKVAAAGRELKNGLANLADWHPKAASLSAVSTRHYAK